MSRAIDSLYALYAIVLTSTLHNIRATQSLQQERKKRTSILLTFSQWVPCGVIKPYPCFLPSSCLEARLSCLLLFYIHRNTHSCPHDGIILGTFCYQSLSILLNPSLRTPNPHAATKQYTGNILHFNFATLMVLLVSGASSSGLCSHA